jgi:hypothetical protein
LDISENDLTRGTQGPADMSGTVAAPQCSAHGYTLIACWWRIGVEAFADSIKKNTTLISVTFGDKKAITMTTDDERAHFGEKLRPYEAQLVAAFLPKCT